MEIIMKTLQNTYSSSTVKINITITNNTFIEYSTSTFYIFILYHKFVTIQLRLC